MEKKAVTILILAIMIVIASVVFFAAKNLSNSPNELEECNTLSYSGEGKANIVFFSKRENAEKYSEALFKISPFKKENFNIYYLDYKPKCELYNGIAVLCYSRDIIKIASSCPNDYIVVLEDHPSNIRSSTYMNVISLNLKSNMNVFAHEFGHAFANLADEYVPAKIPKGSKNCQKACADFNGLGECISGCSEESYYRSINQGIMRTLSSNIFGGYDEKIILSKISNQLPITGHAIEGIINCENEKYYLIEGKLENNEAQVISKTIEFGCIGQGGEGPFSYELLDKENNLLFSEDFNPELIFTDYTETDLSGGPEEYTGNFFLKVPIIENNKQLKIINEDKKTEINLEDIASRPCLI